MKIDTSTLKNQEKSPSRSAKDILPLVSVTQKTLADDDVIGLQLAVNPDDENSQKYKIKAPILKGDEDVRTMLT